MASHGAVEDITFFAGLMKGSLLLGLTCTVGTCTLYMYQYSACTFVGCMCTCPYSIVYINVILPLPFPPSLFLWYMHTIHVDYDRVISHHIQQDQYEQALALLKDHTTRALELTDKVLLAFYTLVHIFPLFYSDHISFSG